MVTALIALAVGLLTGIISGCGVGGGSLLMLYLTVVADIPPVTASVTNLLYFLGTALPALRAHWQNGWIHIATVRRCLPIGLVAVIGGVLIAMWIDTAWLHRLFGILLLYIGIKEVRYRE